MNIASKERKCFGGRTVVLTGAGSGLGRELALRLCTAGAVVHAVDVDCKGLASLVAGATGKGRIHAVHLDVCDLQGFRKMASGISSGGEGIDYLFNNAGITLLGESQNIPFCHWRKVLDVNLAGVMNGILAIYPGMIKRGRGCIINTASIAGSSGYATAAAYAASKAGIIQLSKSLRAEALNHGVRVSVACPGYVKSGIFSQERIFGAEKEDVFKNAPLSMMSTGMAAIGMVKGVIAGKETIVFPMSARFLWGASCWFPGLIAPFQRNLIKVFRKSG